MTLDVSAHFERAEFSIFIDTSLPTDRVSALFGPSGSGKTTLLRLIAGLDRHEGATVKFNGEIWQDENSFVPAHKRQVGYVFQHLNLFPHLSADGNLRYAETRCSKRLARLNRLDREHVIDMLDLSHLLKRFPHELSGGEKQRVAIARALLSNPGVLLMDEPLGSIDAGARNRILPYLQTLHLNLEIPVVYVSHSIDEVLFLADTVYSMSAGRIVAENTALEFSANPGDGNETSAIIQCQVQDKDPEFELTSVRFENQQLLIVADQFRKGDGIRVKIPARDVSITRAPVESSIVNVIETTIAEIDDPGHGPAALLRLGCGEQHLFARITRKSLADLKLTRGETVYAQIKGVALMTDHDR